MVGTIETHLAHPNVVIATKLVGNQMSGRVIVRDEPLMLIIAGQILRAAGYSASLGDS